MQRKSAAAAAATKALHTATYHRLTATMVHVIHASTRF
jgi:hypothetical protein